MKTFIKSLLPKGATYWDALISNASNIKPRLTPKKSGGFTRLNNTYLKLPILGLIVLFLLGYYPVLAFPPVRQATVKASDLSVKTEVISDQLPSPINLPHPGYLSTRYSRYHPGIDIATGLGMPIHPITEGVVEEVNFSFWGLGNYVTISHSYGFKSVYAHMGRIYVKKGQEVKSNNTIGVVGLTGATSGPHTHLEVTKDGNFIDPQTILPTIADFPKAEYLKPVGGGEKTDMKKTLKPDFK